MQGWDKTNVDFMVELPNEDMLSGILPESRLEAIHCVGEIPRLPAINPHMIRHESFEGTNTNWNLGLARRRHHQVNRYH